MLLLWLLINPLTTSNLFLVFGYLDCGPPVYRFTATAAAIIFIGLAFLAARTLFNLFELITACAILFLRFLCSGDRYI